MLRNYDYGRQHRALDSRGSVPAARARLSETNASRSAPLAMKQSNLEFVDAPGRCIL